MKKAFAALNLLLIAAVCVGNYVFQTAGGLPVKAATSTGFVLLGLVNLVFTALRARKRLAFAAFMAIALIFGLLGDIFISFDFIHGAALFACGHVFLLIAHCLLIRPRLTDLTVIGLLIAGSAAFLMRYHGFVFRNDLLQNVCVAYAAIISAMTGKALSGLFRQRTLAALALALGGTLFFFSDLMLALDRFSYVCPHAGTLCMSTYYPAQCLLAAAPFFAAISSDPSGRPS